MSIRRLLVAGALMPLLLSGCQESKAEPKPKLPEATSAPSETSEPVPKKETPQAFIRRWVAASDEAHRTGDGGEFMEMSPRCDACQGFVSTLEAIYAKGGSVEFAGTQVREIRRMANGHPIFDVTEAIPKTLIRHDTGKVEMLPAGTTTIRVTLEKLGGRWAVAEFTKLR